MKLSTHPIVANVEDNPIPIAEELLYRVRMVAEKNQIAMHRFEFSIRRLGPCFPDPEDTGRPYVDQPWVTSLIMHGESEPDWLTYEQVTPAVQTLFSDAAQNYPGHRMVVMLIAEKDHTQKERDRQQMRWGIG